MTAINGGADRRPLPLSAGLSRAAFRRGRGVESRPARIPLKTCGAPPNDARRRTGNDERQNHTTSARRARECVRARGVQEPGPGSPQACGHLLLAEGAFPSHPLRKSGAAVERMTRALECDSNPDTKVVSSLLSRSRREEPMQRKVGISNRETPEQEEQERLDHPPVDGGSPAPEDAAGRVGELPMTEVPNRQTSHKAGSRSIAIKEARVRYPDRSTPPSRKVAGAFGAEPAEISPDPTTPEE